MVVALTCPFVMVTSLSQIEIALLSATRTKDDVLCADPEASSVFSNDYAEASLMTCCVKKKMMCMM